MADGSGEKLIFLRRKFDFLRELKENRDKPGEFFDKSVIWTDPASNCIYLGRFKDGNRYYIEIIEDLKGADQ